jgi:hypothetical protein
LKNPEDFNGTLPYASELFGIYQAILGWKSNRIKERYEGYRVKAILDATERIIDKMKPSIEVKSANQSNPDALSRFSSVKVVNLHPFKFESIALRPYISGKIDSCIARLLREEIGKDPPTDWNAFISYEKMNNLLEEVQKIVNNADLLEKKSEVDDYVKRFFERSSNPHDIKGVLKDLFQRESFVSGYLNFLAQHSPHILTQLFFGKSRTNLLHTIQSEDPLISFGKNNYEAILSPICIVHIFREYFFEFDSFLGTPVGHVWLSPGGTVELIEVNTRKTLTEKTFETLSETINRAETSVTNQDDLADAIKDENRSNTKFGFTNVATYSTPVFQDSATASFSLDNAKMNSRETTHKQMRQQSEKLSSEIKRNFKTAYKTSTEITDTTSKRYVIENKTDKLVNYELRRKMRKVGVQVQDIGVQLCWQTFVDDAGLGLGISKLVHIAEPADLSKITQDDDLVVPKDEHQEVAIPIPYLGEDGENDLTYVNGEEKDVDTFLGVKTEETDIIEPNISTQEFTYEKSGYTLVHVNLDPQGADATLSYKELISEKGSSRGKFIVYLNSVNFNGRNSFTAKATLTWAPTKELIKSVTDENAKRMNKFKEEKARLMKDAFYKAARERLKLASKIKPRPSEDLREEERTIIYRNLVSQLMSVGSGNNKHVTSELIRSIFDVDKMLYFVSPEWWVPRLHKSSVHLGKPPAEAINPSSLSISSYASGTVIPSEYIVSWGGVGEIGRKNYFITEDSDPARFGSSLGWLLQLDGDELRNVLLNSPWVKAVIPIRIGKEQQAINWLEQAHVEGGKEDLDNAEYHAVDDDPPELHSKPGNKVTIRKALNHLIKMIQTANENSRTVIMPNPTDPDNPANHFAGSMPSEAVFEHGFYFLKGGVRFNDKGTQHPIFSQWMEILPTDQTVALEVEYDPKTLQIKDR